MSLANLFVIPGLHVKYLFRYVPLLPKYFFRLFVFLEIKTVEGMIDGAHMVNWCHLLTLCGDI